MIVDRSIPIWTVLERTRLSAYILLNGELYFASVLLPPFVAGDAGALISILPDERVLTERSWERADGLEDSETCEHSVLGVIVIGQGRGESFRVCIAKEKCKVHWGAWQRERAKRAKMMASAEGKTGEDREASYQKRLEAERSQRDVEQKLRAKAEPLILRAMAEKIRKANATATGQLAVILLRRLRGYGSRTNSAVPPGTTAEDLVRHLAFLVVQDQARGGWDWGALRQSARGIGVDTDRILKSLQPVQTSAKLAASAKKGGKPKRGVCRICGCTEEKACYNEKTGKTCSWVDRGKTLCSSCEGKEKKAAVKPPRAGAKKRRKAK